MSFQSEAAKLVNGAREWYFIKDVPDNLLEYVIEHIIYRGDVITNEGFHYEEAAFKIMIK
jgi:hypothetical protein